MKKRLIILTVLYSFFAFAQEPADKITPQQAPFSPGQNISGFVQSSINEPTGKVTFPVPITSISARTVSYNVSLGYNGQVAFDIGLQTNKYAPVSTVGVGFSMFIPKVVVDNKNTATKQDDEFYLQDGAANARLFCINKIAPGVLQTGEIIWEFRSEKYVPYKIRYYKGLKEYVNGVLAETSLDYWKITNDQGVDYFYGQTQNAKENLVAWGNWIGNSNRTSGGKRETIIWNLSTIRDQWSNNIKFEYEHQEVSMGGVQQTEATYLKKIISSTGENIRFVYMNKNVNEYYEPYKQKVEPDAYQERYEKKYLDYVASYDSSNQLVFTYDLTYLLLNNSSASDKKRYLTNITQENSSGETLPGQKFEYYTTGTFKGGIKKITYPAGGAVSYTYKNQALFTNSHFRGTATDDSNYRFYSLKTSENYTLKLLKAKTAVNGRYNFKAIRNFWDGQQWKAHTFNLPYRINDTHPATGPWLENFHSVFGQDFYGFLYKDGDTARMDLFHLEADGLTWNHRAISNINIGPGVPSFISGNKFVAIGSADTGKLYTYTWNYNSWSTKIIDQGGGRYHYGANNNFILSLNRRSSILSNERDYITGANREDYYYMHYLDIQGNWVSKTWSASLDPHIAGIEKPSYFYPDNALSGFVADDNPELFIRWDKNYNILAVDNVLGSYVDQSPIISTYTGMFVLQGHWYQSPLKMARFDGVDWKVLGLPGSLNYYARPTYGEDIMTYQGNLTNSAGFAHYNANSDSWAYNSALTTYPRFGSNDRITGVTKEFLIAGDNIYKFSNTSFTPSLHSTLPYQNIFSHTDGLGHAFIELATYEVSGNTASQTRQKGLFYYTDKKTGTISNIDVGNKYHLSGPNSFAGRTPFMSSKSIWLTAGGTSRYLYRIIDDKIQNLITSKVVSKVQIDNGKGEVRETKYVYSKPNSTPNNEATFFGTVTVENKGYGSSSIGIIEKKYDNGSSDIRKAGLLLEEYIKSTSNETLSHTLNTWTNYETIAKTYTIKQTKQESVTNYNGNYVKQITENEYNAPYYLLSKTKSTNSKGLIEEASTNYASSQYSALQQRNFLSLPYQTTTKIGGKVTSVNRNIWTVDANNKIYAKNTWSGNTESNLRKSSEVTQMNSYGQVIESTNGKGQYNVVIYGYNYRYPITTISNATYNDVINNLDVSINSLQALNNTNLKIELSKLYSRLTDAMIKISIYDSQGKLIKRINERQDEMNYYYDSFNRPDYTTDINGKVLNKSVYNYGTN